MAKTKRELFSLARKCDNFHIRLESGLKKKGAKVVFMLTRYSGPLEPKYRIKGIKYSHSTLVGNKFPARVVRRAFEFAQLRADELGQEVRIVINAELKEEYGGEWDNFAIATIKPREIFEPINIPIPTCSMCSCQATQKCVTGLEGNKWGTNSVIIEYGCDEHIHDIRGHWE